MRVLLSIKPEYAYKIFEGTKKFEFRKIRFKNPNIKTVVVYASSPVQKVIGEFEIEDILSFDPDRIWRITEKYSGISEAFFMNILQIEKLRTQSKLKVQPSIQNLSLSKMILMLIPRNLLSICN
ncbi:ASCH domain-containing protein [Pedobacter sp. P26]|uniref:ASCH domain-containing protein n=1 Tax=Pedobacter sp. P26 TaxID=3423956 RepID=UPI003D66727E